MGRFVQPGDLAPWATIPDQMAGALIADAEAQAIHVAPCLATAPLDADQRAFVLSILRSAIIRRWKRDNDDGKQVTIGQVSVGPGDTSHPGRILWDSEIRQLQALCARLSGSGPGAFTIDTGLHRAALTSHRPWCDTMLGRPACSCGADLTGDGPLWEP